MFFSSTLTISITEQFLSISLFFILLLKPVTMFIVSLKSLSNKDCDMYPFSSYNFLYTL